MGAAGCAGGDSGISPEEALQSPAQCCTWALPAEAGSPSRGPCTLPVRGILPPDSAGGRQDSPVTGCVGRPRGGGTCTCGDRLPTQCRLPVAPTRLNRSVPHSPLDVRLAELSGQHRDLGRLGRPEKRTSQGQTAWDLREGAAVTASVRAAASCQCGALRCRV